MISLLLLSFISLACVGVVVGAGAFVVRLTIPGSQAIAAAGGLVALGAVSGALLLATPFGADVVRGVGLTFLVLATAVIVGAVFRRRISGAIPIVMLSAGVLTFSLGVLGRPSPDGMPFAASATRFLPWALPEDNRIPAILASWLVSPGSGEYLIGDWLPSDRPPLQAGVILLVRSGMWLIQQLSGGVFSDNDVDYLASVAAQSVWILGAVCVCLAVGFRMRAAVAAIAVAAVVPVMLVNTLYTWPKLFAGGMAVAAIGVLVVGVRSHAPRTPALVLAAALTAFAMLSHGGAAFVLPIILGLAVVLLARMRTWRRRILASVIAVGVALAIYAPWVYFQRVVSPPGDRLLKWHLAGVIPVDERSFVEAFIDQYSTLSPGEFWNARLSNLAHAFDFRILEGLDLWASNGIERRLTAEFYETPIALSLGILPLIALLLVAAVRRIRGSEIDSPTRWSVALALAAVGSLILWALVLFSPDGALVHQGSHAWMILLLVMPFAWLFSERPWIGAILAALQIALTLVLTWSAPLHPEVTAVTWCIAAGIALLAIAVLISRDTRVDRGAVVAAPSAIAPGAQTH